MKNPYADYSTIAQEGLSGRELEAFILTKASNKLKNCLTNWEQPKIKSLLGEALSYNQKVWTFFQTELSSSDNQMPKELRQNLLSISLFIDRHTLSAMAFPDQKKLTVLIDINMNLATALRGENS